jgi:hypothetical protein
MAKNLKKKIIKHLKEDMKTSKEKRTDDKKLIKEIKDGKKKCCTGCERGKGCERQRRKDAPKRGRK